MHVNVVKTKTKTTTVNKTKYKMNGIIRKCVAKKAVKRKAYTISFNIIKSQKPFM